MFIKLLLTVLATLSYAPLAYSNAQDGAQKIKLQYSAGVPVELITTQSIDIDQLIPGLDFNGHGKQMITSRLTLDGGNAGKQMAKPPFSLEWTLLALEVDFSSNGKELVFDSREPQKSLFSRELAKWVDRTLKLTINENLSLTRNNVELDDFAKKFPVVTELDPYTFLEGLILPMFALADQELAKGDSITKKQLRGDLGLAFSSLNYEITEVTDKQVVAQFKGEIEPRAIPLKGILGDSEKGFGLIQLSISGDVKGLVSWDRTNALLCQISGDYDYRAHLKFASIEWPLSVRVKSSLQTSTARMTEMVQSNPMLDTF